MGEGTQDVLKMSIADLSESIRKKEISPVEVAKTALQAIDEKDKTLNAFITVTAEEAVAEAKKSEEEIMAGHYRGPLHGIPIALKDLIFTKGVKTTSASEIYKDYIPDYDAEIVVRLKNAGAVMIGKLNMHQFAYGTTGDRSYFGPARNPHNLSKVTGGSSSGSGAAVAGFMAYGAIGSDTGGSIRIPASCCGIVGMKPTFGRVSKHGSFVLSWTLDHLGPMTRSVMDNALMMNAIAGFDEKDPYSVKSPVEDFTAEIGKGIKGCKVGVPTTFFFDLIQPEVQRIFDINLERMKNQGAEIRYINLEHMDELLIAQQTIIAAEAYAALEKEVREQPEKIEEEVRARIISGLPIKASDYLRALKVKHAAVEHFLHVLNEVDVIMTPTLCALPPDIDQREIDFNGIKEHPRILARLTGPEDTLGFPAISVPGGFSADGLPVGIQFIGKPFAEKTLYRFAHCIECSD